jgi:septal ring factor EnvC (AmiA/AmiB activator)
MNQPTNPSPQQPDGIPAAADAPLIDRNLSVVLQDDHDAVAEDLRQAKELAATLESQLAGKSKELMHLKFLLEQSKTHLGHMQDGIVAMRKERHKLANTVLRSPVMDLMLARATAERDALRNELNRVLAELAAEKAPKPLQFDERDHQIAELTVQLATLRQEVVELRRKNARPATVAPEPPPTSSPLKTPEEASTWLESAVEIVATERVLGNRAKS